jgi:hypothetical protein
MPKETPLVDNYSLEFEVTVYQLLLLLDIESDHGSWELLANDLLPDGLDPEAQKQFTQSQALLKMGLIRMGAEGASLTQRGADAVEWFKSGLDRCWPHHASGFNVAE